MLKTLRVRVDPNLFDALQMLSRRNDRRFPDEVRRALRLYVESEAKRRG